MAFHLLNHVWEMSLPAARKLVLLSLADHAHETSHRCWPGVVRVAERTGLTTRAVQHHLRALEHDGLIRVESQLVRGRGRATVYVVLEGVRAEIVPPEKGERGSPFVPEPDTDSPEKGERPSPFDEGVTAEMSERVNAATEKGERGSPQPSRTRTTTRARARGEAIGDAPAGAGAPVREPDTGSAELDGILRSLRDTLGMPRPPTTSPERP